MSSRGAMIAAALGALALGANAGPAFAGAGQAVTFQGDVAHTGFVQEPGLDPPLRRAWSRPFPGEISYPVIAGGRVFVTARDRRGAANPRTHLVALDASSGSVLWERELPGPFGALPAYDAGRVFVMVGGIGEDGGGLHAFDASDGAHLWHVAFQTSASPPVAQGGVVYVSGSVGPYGAYNAADGARLWEGTSDDAGRGAPALSGDTVYFSFACPNVYAVRRSDGALLWRTETGCHGGGGSTPVLHAGRLYVLEDDEFPPGDVYDAATGAVIADMRADYPPAFRGRLGLFPDAREPGEDSLVGHRLVAQTADGRVRWRFAGDGYLDTSPLIVNRTAYVASGSGRVYGVALRSGRAVWRGKVPGPVPSSLEEIFPSGLGAGEGLLIVPAVRRLVAFR